MIKNKHSLLSFRQGFTLIELLVVLFIIGILASLILANILGARQRAEDVQRKNDLQQMQKALRLFYNDYQRYPDSTQLNKGERFEVEETVYMGQLPEEFEYFVDNNEDLFRLWVSLDNSSDQDISKSQSRCPEVAGMAVYDDNDYVVCEY